jgi:uncharacterized protein YbbC (DUF1343 family)
MIRLGLEQCTMHPPAALRGARFGLLMNQASVDSQLGYACDVLAARFPGQLAALFSPQHGLWCEQQANMIESPHGWYSPLGLPVFSLYGPTRTPTADMLRGLDCFVVDLQDVGTRVYTFIWSLTHCLEACAAAQIPVVILDRPNPLGGEIVEGPLLAPGYESFVGRLPIPMRHALTIGELGLLARDELRLDGHVEVVRMVGWRRNMLFPETGRRWVAPSPNMPRAETTLLYPGQVLLEGTNLSEGRGTTAPFEVTGAPYVDPHQLVRALNPQALAGLAPRPLRFTPTFDKWRGESCGGIALHIVDARAVRSFRATLAILAAVQKLWPGALEWLPPPYEYELEKQPIDILFGSPELRESLNGACCEADLDRLSAVDSADWHRRINAIRLYD